MRVIVFSIMVFLIVGTAFAKSPICDVFGTVYKYGIVIGVQDKSPTEGFKKLLKEAPKPELLKNFRKIYKLGVEQGYKYSANEIVVTDEILQKEYRKAYNQCRLAQFD